MRTLRDRRGQFGLARNDLFGAKALACQAERFARRGQARRCLIASGQRRITRSGARAAGFEQIDLALEFALCVARGRFGFFDTRLRQQHFPRARAPLEFRIVGLRQLNARFGQCNRFTVRLRIDVRDALPFRNRVAFIHQHVGQPAHHAKSKFDFAYVDVAV